MTPKEAFKRLVDSIDVYDESFDLTSHDMWALGMRSWETEKDEKGRDNGKELWLFPRSFYEHIPAGFPLVFIDFRRGEFVPGVTDDDERFGFLAYGVLGRTK